MDERNNARGITAGAILATGLFQVWIAADFMAAIYFVMRPRYVPGRALAIVIAIPMLTIFWSADWLAPLLWGMRIFLLQNLIRDNWQNRNSVISIVTIGVLLQAVFALWVFTDHRPIVFSVNSEVMGAVGVAMLYPGSVLGFAGALTVGASGARLAVALAWLPVIFGPRRRFAFMLAGIASVLFVIQAFAISPERLTVDRLLHDWGIRETLITLDNEQNAKEVIAIHRPDLLAKPIERHWKWFGYGYRSYVERTGASTPHNTWILAFYELGIFALPFGAAAMWTIRKWPIWSILAALAYLSFVDAWYWMPSCAYAVAIFVYTVRGSSRTNGETVPSSSTMPLS